MARLRQGRLRSRGEVGEDVNPSAYIVNLADCMLVLACGFMVALISYWNIDVTPAQELDGEQLEEVDPETMPEDVTEGGSYYIEAGKVYQDPNTGQLYMVQETDGDAEGATASGGAGAGAEGGSSVSADGSSSDSSAASNSGAGETSGNSVSGGSASSAGSGSEDAIRNARAAGAD